MHRFDIASLSAAPWKNGGGVTREIVCSPAGAGMEGFDWRASIATIDKPGPFSAFAGVDRVIMLLDGAGVRLRSQDGRVDHRLEVPHASFAFAGDVAVHCELLGGASTDFNVMSRQGRLKADVRVLRESGDVEPVERGLLLALAGRWRFNDIDCESGSGVWWDGEILQWQATTSDAAAAMVAVRLEPTATP
ncbi:HutD family protein [Variovorax sp. J22P240]|uniref:HutD/Ves family protein n=1 Tax=Variovorax sp. J22P240 TaxID=3053514 RepID=UPI0025766DCC|nr:HutD family protein [Variovorax sp. J22P240]MDM0002406.1 HutD family protein [Variovorax sp. J22P240]